MAAFEWPFCLLKGDYSIYRQIFGFNKTNFNIFIEKEDNIHTYIHYCQREIFISYAEKRSKNLYIRYWQRETMSKNLNRTHISRLR